MTREAEVEVLAARVQPLKAMMEILMSSALKWNLRGRLHLTDGLTYSGVIVIVELNMVTIVTKFTMLGHPNLVKLVA